MASTLGRPAHSCVGVGGGAAAAARLALPALGRPARVAPPHPTRRSVHSSAAAAAADEPADIAAARARLNASSTTGPGTITGPQLRKAVFDKWGRDYAVLLARRGPRIFFQVLWKHLEQASYPLSAQDHADTYDAVASYLSDWGAGGTVRAGIAAASRRGPGFTGGGAARAISIPLDVDLSTARGAEFL